MRRGQTIFSGFFLFFSFLSSLPCDLRGPSIKKNGAEPKFYDIFSFPAKMFYCFLLGRRESHEGDEKPIFFFGFSSPDVIRVGRA